MTSQAFSLAEEKTPITSWFTLFNVITVTILTIISSIATIIANSSIVGELGIEGSIEQWVVILYMLGINSTVPIGTWLGDKFGHKKIFFIGILFFIFGSLISSVSNNFTPLGIGRLVEGLGGGIIYTVGLAQVLHSFPKKMLPLALNLYIGLGFGLGFGLGTFLGGLFAQLYSWRLIFIINIPICLISLIVVSLTQRETEKRDLEKFDFWGYLTFTVAVCFLIVALTNGNLRSTTYGWRSPIIIGLIAFSAICIILNLIIEKNHPSPIVPLKLFKYPIFVVGIFALFSLGMIVFGSVTLMNNFMEQSLKFQKFTVGLVLIIYGISIGISSILSTFIMRYAPILFVVSVGITLIVYSNILNNQLTFLSDKTMIALILVLRGVGVGLSLGPINTYALKNVPKELSSEAATLLTFFRQVGATYGGSILTIITIRREFFYNLIFKEGITSESVGFKEVMRKISIFISKENGNTAMLAKQRTQELIVQNALNQSFIQAMNDALIVLTWVLAITGVVMLALSFVKKKPPKTIP